MNILTIDLEDWFCHDNYSQDFNWHQHEVRIEIGLDLILEELDKNNTKATFFCLGWIAEHQPQLVKKIYDSGHHIGCHSYQHQLSYRFDKRQFKDDTGKAKLLLEDLIGDSVDSFRAPSFSITKNNLYAFEALVELGFEYDCSVFPALRECGGLPDLELNTPVYINYNGCVLKEFPMSVLPFFGKKIIYSGGGYFRIFPYPLLRLFTRNSNYVMTYFHPSDFDPFQPSMKNLSRMRRFKNEIGLKYSYQKFQKYLADFTFINIKEADGLIDWNNAKTVYL